MNFRTAMVRLLKPFRGFHKTYTLKHLIKTVIIFLIVYFIICYFLLQLTNYRKYHENSEVSSTKINLPYVIVHLDLKGAPPKLSYLDSLLPILKEQGANGLLIEYEDMFPYEGVLEELSSKHCYKKAELSRFLMSATDIGFEIIPLIQTFGHMEFVLKHEKHSKLREVKNHSDSICPTLNNSKKLLRLMLQQVLEFHLESSPVNYIHIGCDEVFHINKCSLCRRRNSTEDDIFLQHIVEISTFVKLTNPNVQVLIWDDMLRRMKPNTLTHYNLQDHVEPVYWDYRADIKQVTHANLYKYYFTFNKSIWIASAFKGADGKKALIPDLSKRFRNQYEWMKLIKGYNFGGNPVNFKGIFLTGWSRYSHFKPLCELLTASIHSLVLALLVIKQCKIDSNIIKPNEDFHQFYDNIEEDFRKNLYCQRRINLQNFDNSHCFYAERHVYPAFKNYLHNLTFIKQKCKLDSRSNNMPLDENEIIEMQANNEDFAGCMEILQNAEENIVEVLKLYYDDYVINEFVEKSINVYKTKLYKEVKLNTYSDSKDSSIKID